MARWEITTNIAKTAPDTIHKQQIQGRTPRSGRNPELKSMFGKKPIIPKPKTKTDNLDKPDQPKNSTIIETINFNCLDPLSKISTILLYKIKSKCKVILRINNHNDTTKILTNAENRKIQSLDKNQLTLKNLGMAYINNVFFDASEDPETLKQVIQLIQDYSPLDFKTLKALQEHCNLRSPELDLFNALIKEYTNPGKLISTVNKKYSSKEYPHIHFQLAEFFEQKGELCPALDMYTCIEQNNPNFIDASEKIYPLYLKIQKHPELTQEIRIETDHKLFDYLYKNRSYNDKFQDLLDKHFHKLTSSTSVKPVYHQVGSEEFISQMAEIMQLKKQLLELEQENKLLEKQLNEKQEKTNQESNSPTFFKK